MVLENKTADIDHVFSVYFNPQCKFVCFAPRHTLQMYGVPVSLCAYFHLLAPALHSTLFLCFVILSLLTTLLLFLVLNLYLYFPS